MLSFPPTQVCYFWGREADAGSNSPSDMQTIQKEEPDLEVREVTNPDGGGAIFAKSIPIVAEPLGDTLLEDTLP